MTALMLCEPLFRYLCQLNRSANYGINPEMDNIRAKVIGILQQIAEQSGAVPELDAKFDAKSSDILNKILVYFVDATIESSDLPFANAWPRLETEIFGEQVGDQQFWHFLDHCLNDTSNSQDDLLAVYYVCIGLGFTGSHAGQPELIRSIMNKITDRLKHNDYPSLAEQDRLCPEAYTCTDHSDLVEPPPRNIMRIAILLLGAVAVLFIANIYLYHSAKSEMESALLTIKGLMGP